MWKRRRKQKHKNHEANSIFGVRVNSENKHSRFCLLRFCWASHPQQIPHASANNAILGLNLVLCALVCVCAATHRHTIWLCFCRLCAIWNELFGSGSLPLFHPSYPPSHPPSLYLSLISMTLVRGTLPSLYARYEKNTRQWQKRILKRWNQSKQDNGCKWLPKNLSFSIQWKACYKQLVFFFLLYLFTRSISLN